MAKISRSEKDQADFDEAVELLILWYRRWQGSLSAVPPELPERTRDFVRRHGDNVPTPGWLR